MKLIQYEPITPKKVLNAVRAPSMPFDWSINPYRGCQHGCSFCYARSTHVYMGESADDAFQRHIFWKENAPETLRQQLKRMSRLPESVAIGTATDPYQQAEGQRLLTRKCLTVLADFGVPVTITTRSPLIERDLDILVNMPGSSVNISVHSLDPVIWRAFEPSTPSPRLRLATLRKIRQAGIHAGLFLAPMLPYLTDDAASTEAVIVGAGQAGASFVMPSFLRLSTPEVKTWFFESLRQTYPQLTESYGQLYWQTSSPPEAYRKPIMTRIRQQLGAYGLNAGHGGVQAARSAAEAGASQARIAKFAQAGEVGPAQEAACAPVQLTLF